MVKIDDIRLETHSSLIQHLFHYLEQLNHHFEPDVSKNLILDEIEQVKQDFGGTTPTIDLTQELKKKLSALESSRDYDTEDLSQSAELDSIESAFRKTLEYLEEN